MSTIRVNTTQNIQLELELGSLGDRILGRLIDWLILIVYGVTIVLLLTVGNTGLRDYAPWLLILAFLPIVLYDLILEITLNGQSIGKKVMGIRVVSLDGERPTIGQYLIRWLFRLVDFSLTNSLCAVLCVAVSRKHQRLGDMVAGTGVIKTTHKIKLEETLYVPIQEDYDIQFPEVANLKESDIQLIKEVLRHHVHEHNLLLLHNTAQKIKEVLHLQNDLDPYSFLTTIIADYNYQSSRE